MLAPPLLLDALPLHHRPLELGSLVHRLRDVPRPFMPPAQEVSAVVGRQKSGGRITYRETFPISASALQRDLRLSRYSMAARSRAVMIPSLSDACAFQTRTLPSSEPESTNRESPVYSVDMTLPRRHSASVICSPTIAVEPIPLHAFCVIDLRRGPPSFLPYSNCPIPTAADEFEACWAPVAGHDSGDVPFVYLRGGGERADVKRVKIVVLRGEKHRGRERRRPR